MPCEQWCLHHDSGICDTFFSFSVEMIFFCYAQDLSGYFFFKLKPLQTFCSHSSNAIWFNFFKKKNLLIIWLCNFMYWVRRVSRRSEKKIEKLFSMLDKNLELIYALSLLKCCSVISSKWIILYIIIVFLHFPHTFLICSCFLYSIFSKNWHWKKAVQSEIDYHLC